MRKPSWPILLLLTALVSMTAAAPSWAADATQEPPSVLDGPAAASFATPEDAIAEYLAGVAEANVQRILRATAADKIAQQARFELFIDRIRAFQPFMRIAPVDYPFFSDITRTMQEADLLTGVRMLAYSLLTEVPLHAAVITGDELDPGPLPWAREFIRQADPARLSGLVIEGIARPDPELLDSSRYRTIAAEQSAAYGAVDQTERIALVSFEGATYLLGFTLLDYGDDWRILRPMSAIGGTDPQGIAMPITPGDFEDLATGA